MFLVREERKNVEGGKKICNITYFALATYTHGAVRSENNKNIEQHRARQQEKCVLL